MNKCLHVAVLGKPVLLMNKVMVGHLVSLLCGKSFSKIGWVSFIFRGGVVELLPEHLWDLSLA